MIEEMKLMIGLHEAVLQNVGWHTAKTVEMRMLHESKTQIWELEICWVKKTRIV